MSRQQSVLRNTVGSCHLATSTELYRLCIFTSKRAAGRKPWGKLSPAASHDLLCQLWKAALWDRIRTTPLVGVQPTDRQLHHLLQRHAPLQAALKTRRKQAPLSAKTKFAPTSGSSKPPSPGPTIPEIVSCNPLKVAAEGSSESETTWGTIDVQAGALKANPIPMKNTLTRMRGALSRRSQPSSAKERAVAAKQTLIAHTSF